jgi:hypothetical protein
MATQPKSLRNRVIERRRMLGSELTPNARNFRTHPDEQRAALRGVLTEIGQAGELLLYRSERNGGKLTLVDGHLRAEDYANQEWDVAITDLTDSEADKLLAVHDPLAAMAGTDTEQLDALLADLETDDAGLQALLDDLATGDEEPELKNLDIKEPPKMAWALIGIPVVRFGEIAELIEQIAAVPGTTVETTANDG